MIWNKRKRASGIYSVVFDLVDEDPETSRAYGPDNWRGRLERAPAQGDVIRSGPSALFELCRRANLARRQVTYRYKGHYREFCPHILGHTGGREVALVYQFGGGSSHRKSQRCVTSVYVDVNPDVPNQPGRS